MMGIWEFRQKKNARNLGEKRRCGLSLCRSVSDFPTEGSMQVEPLAAIDHPKSPNAKNLKTFGGTPKRDPCSFWGLIWGHPRNIGVT